MTGYSSTYHALSCQFYFLLFFIDHDNNLTLIIKTSAQKLLKVVYDTQCFFFTQIQLFHIKEKPFNRYCRKQAVLIRDAQHH